MPAGRFRSRASARASDDPSPGWPTRAAARVGLLAIALSSVEPLTGLSVRPARAARGSAAPAPPRARCDLAGKPPQMSLREVGAALKSPRSNTITAARPNEAGEWDPPGRRGPSLRPAFPAAAAALRVARELSPVMAGRLPPARRRPRRARVRLPPRPLATCRPTRIGSGRPQRTAEPPLLAPGLQPIAPLRGALVVANALAGRDQVAAGQAGQDPIGHLAGQHPALTSSSSLKAVGRAAAVTRANPRSARPTISWSTARSACPIRTASAARFSASSGSPSSRSANAPRRSASHALSVASGGPPKAAGPLEPTTRDRLLAAERRRVPGEPYGHPRRAEGIVTIVDSRGRRVPARRRRCRRGRATRPQAPDLRAPRGSPRFAANARRRPGAPGQSPRPSAARPAARSSRGRGAVTRLRRESEVLAMGDPWRLPVPRGSWLHATIPDRHVDWEEP